MENFFDTKKYKVSFKKYLDETEYGNHLEIFNMEISINKENNQKEIVFKAEFSVIDTNKSDNKDYYNLFFDADNYQLDAKDNCEDLFKKQICLYDIRKWIYINHFEVSENYRGLKIGTNAFNEILKKVKYSKSFDVISLTPSSINESKDAKKSDKLKETKMAKKFWESVGFSKLKRKTYIYNKEELKRKNILKSDVKVTITIPYSEYKEWDEFRAEGVEMVKLSIKHDLTQTLKKDGVNDFFIEVEHQN